MVKSVDNDNGTTLYEYYMDKPVVDKSDALVFLDYQAVLGAEVVRNKNLIRRVVYSSGTIGDVDYELDAAGRVRKCILSTQGMDAGYYALGYECE